MYKVGVRMSNFEEERSGLWQLKLHLIPVSHNFTSFYAGVVCSQASLEPVSAMVALRSAQLGRRRVPVPGRTSTDVTGTGKSLRVHLHGVKSSLFHAHIAALPANRKAIVRQRPFWMPSCDQQACILAGVVISSHHKDSQRFALLMQ